MIAVRFGVDQINYFTVFLDDLPVGQGIFGDLRGVDHHHPFRSLHKTRITSPITGFHKNIFRDLVHLIILLSCSFR